MNKLQIVINKNQALTANLKPVNMKPVFHCQFECAFIGPHSDASKKNQNVLNFTLGDIHATVRWHYIYVKLQLNPCNEEPCKCQLFHFWKVKHFFFGVYF